MTLTSKYTCACNSSTTVDSPTTGVSCCEPIAQPAPSPCCESHEVVYKAGVCLKPACNVVANASSFFLKFSNLCDVIPVDGNNVYLFHPAVGLMRVIGIDQYYTYQVMLVDESKAGGLIEQGDCVLVAVVPESSLASASRCLSGMFTAPAVNGTETIYIENGSGIPIGSTITFTANGESGSYNVLSFVSASGTIYAYDVQNTGNGHTPGTIIDGGCEGACVVPIELITDVDICDLSDTNEADSLTACVNGTPRGLKSTSTNDYIKGDGDGGWTLGTLVDTECCVVIDDCLKFTGDSVCSGGSDSVELRSTGIDCFEEAWQKVLDSNPTADNSTGGGVGQTKLPMSINGFAVVVTDYNSGTRIVTLAPADADALTPGEIISFDAGDQICLGDCCKSCLNGPLITNHRILPEADNNVGGVQYGTIFACSTVGEIAYETGVKHYYLVGFDDSDPLTVTVLELDSSWDSNPTTNGPGNPKISDPLVLRNKICNVSANGCDQYVEAGFNYELTFEGLPAGVRVNYSIGHFIQSAPTLDDGSPNPFNSLLSQAGSSGYVDGPSSDSASIIGNSSLGFAGQGANKPFPYIQNYFEDVFYLEKCNCGLGYVWLYLETEVIDGSATGTLNQYFALRERYKFFNANETRAPRNNPTQQGFS